MYIDGFLVPVPTKNKEAYRKMAEKGWTLFKEFGATGMMEAWGDDVPKGKLTDFYGAVKAEDARPWCSPGSSGRTRPRVTKAIRR